MSIDQYPPPSSTGGGASVLDDLTDATVTSPADTEVFIYDNATSQWINRLLTIADLPDLSSLYDEAGTAASAVSAHESDTTSVHGIPDTSLLDTIAARNTAIAAAIASLIGTAPGVLDTLGEISDAINDDANLYTTLTGLIAGKLAIASNLSDLANVSTARTNLGLGTAATQASTAFDAAGAATSAVTAHEGASDPHTGYQKESEKGNASGYASLNGSTKVVEDPANATATPTASKIPISGAGGKLDAGWLQEVLGLTDLSDSVISSPANRNALIYDSASGKWVNSTIADADLPSSLRRRNLINSPEDFDVGGGVWAKSSATITPNAIIAPNGSLTADKLLPSNTSSVTKRADQTGIFVVGQPGAAAVFAKAGEYSWLRLTIGTSQTFFDVGTGAVGTTAAGVTPTITSFGNGWYLCTAAIASVVGSDLYGVSLSDGDNNATFVGVTTSGLYIWGAQAYASALVPNYIPVVRALQDAEVPASIARDYETRSVIGTVNLITHPEDFDDAYWTKTRASITANATTAPDGTTTADKLVEDATATTTHFVEVTPFVSSTDGSWSIFAKAAERSWIRVGFRNASTQRAAYFDLTNGVVGNIVGSTFAPTMTYVGDGWWRCTFSGLGADRVDRNTVFVWLANGDSGGTYTGDGASGAYIWGAQAKVTDTPHLYTPRSLYTIVPILATDLPTHGAAQHTDVIRPLYVDATAFIADGATLTVSGSAPESFRMAQMADAATQGVLFNVLLPLDAKAASQVTCKLIYAPGGGSANPFVFSINSIKLSETAIVTATGTTLQFTDTPGTATTNARTDTDVFELSPSASAEDLIRVNVRRLGSDAADTNTNTLRLFSAIIYYTAIQ